jgi:hypothetical protein
MAEEEPLTPEQIARREEALAAEDSLADPWYAALWDEIIEALASRDPRRADAARAVLAVEADIPLANDPPLPAALAAALAEAERDLDQLGEELIDKSVDGRISTRKFMAGIKTLHAKQAAVRVARRRHAPVQRAWSSLDTAAQVVWIGRVVAHLEATEPRFRYSPFIGIRMQLAALEYRLAIEPEIRLEVVAEMGLAELHAAARALLTDLQALPDAPPALEARARALVEGLAAAVAAPVG